MKYTVEQTFYDLKDTVQGWSYLRYNNVLKLLIHQMRDEIGHMFIGEEYRNLRFVMNIPFYRGFCIACEATCHDIDIYRGIRIILDPSLAVADSNGPEGIVRLIYEDPEVKRNPYMRHSDDVKATFESTMDIIRNNCNTFFLPPAKPHIDHVKFNGPATIVFWKDGTKTVVKHDGKGRKDKRLAILYAFMRKIYGEGKPYHNILNEIEEAIK